MAHKVFEKPIRVHFSNCDPAGIVFHPQYFVLINELMEDFLEDVAGVGFIEIRRYGVGFPVVSVKTQFTKPLVLVIVSWVRCGWKKSAISRSVLPSC